MSNQTNNSNIKIEFGPLTVDSVAPHGYKQGISTAQLRQVVTTTYPSVVVGNSRSASLFSQTDFNLPDGQSYTSIRVTWINVPNGTTIEQVQARINQLGANARIQRVISNNIEDVLTAEQHQAIAAGLRSLEDFKESLRVKRVDPATGEIVNIEGAPQYRQNFFSDSAKADEDYRSVQTVSTNDVATTQERNVAALSEVVL